MDPLRVAVLGGTLPDGRFQEIASNDRGERFANQRFGRSLLAALQTSDAVLLQVTAAPATDYPHNQQLIFKQRTYHDDGVDYLEVAFVNVTAIKHLTRLWSAIRHGMPEMRRHGSQVILVHGILSPFLAAALLASRRLGIPAVVIITDPPNVAHAFDNAFSLALKGIDGRMIRRMLPHFDGVVAVTQQVVADFAPGSPELILEGFAPELHLPASTTRRDRLQAVYAGGVKAAYGVDLLVQAQALPSANFDVAVYGAGPYVDEVMAAQERQPGVRYGGVVDFATLHKAYSDADVLVSARWPDLHYAPYTFPSKLLEYLATGKPVVSTRLPGIPREYWDVIVGCEPTPQSVADAIARAAREETVERRARRLAFAEQRKPSSQGRRLVRFLRSAGRPRTMEAPVPPAN